MKRYWSLLSLLLVLYACEKSTNHSQSKGVKIDFITGIGTISYEGEQIKAIGDDFYSYNDQGELVSTRQSTVTSPPYPIEKLYKYSYGWQNGNLVSSIIDSFKLIPLINDTGSLVPKGIIETNIPYAEYFYENGRIDSIHYYSKSKTNIISKKFVYNSDGNIIIERDSVLFQMGFGGSLPIQTITEYEYDDHLNPYYIIYKNTGILSPMLEDNNFSPNNPVKQSFRTVINGNELSGDTFINYTYNAAGLTIKSEITGSAEIVEFKYK